MTPYYEHSGVTIYHGDCRDVMDEWEGLRAKPFDLLLTDPPYGIGACNRSDGGVGSIASGSKFYGRETWDLVGADSATVVAYVRLARQAIVWGGNYFQLPPSSCWLVWNKQQRHFTFADAELAWTNFDKAVRVFDYSRGELASEGKQHPTQKPEALMCWCIRQAGDPRTILDPFMGSGSTLMAAKRNRISAVGIEQEERYCEIAANRLAQEVLPLEMAG